MKINAETNVGVQVRTTAAALATLGLQPFTKLSSFTKRGNLVVPTGNGWAWISRFDADPLPLVADLEDLERAEKALALKVKFA